MYVQVVLARQLANQPSQLPLQRLTSEQMQQLQLQVQDHHQRQRQVGPLNPCTRKFESSCHVRLLC